MAPYCPKCHAENLDTANFCSACGEPLGAEVRLPPVRPTSGQATASLTLGIVSVVVCCCAPGTGVLAIVFGFMARRSIRRSGGRLTGNDMAFAGIVLGIVGTVVQLSILIPNFQEAQVRGRRARESSILRSMGESLNAYHIDQGTYPPTLDLLPPPENPIAWTTADEFSPKSSPAPLRYFPFNPRTEDGRTVYDAFIVISRGPDKVFQIDPERDLASPVPLTVKEAWTRLSEKYYDESNGTRSAGDLFYQGRYPSEQKKE